MNKFKSLLLLIILALIVGVGYVYSRSPKKIKIENNNEVAVSAEENNAEEVKEKETNKDVAEINGDNSKVEKTENKTESKKDIPADNPIKSPTNQDPVAQKSDGIKIINRLVSWGYQSASGRKIDTIVIHSSYNALGGDEYDVDKLIKEYKEYSVAPHYLIDRKGNIYKLVEEKNIAYHAGEAKVPDGRTNVNNFSIGIELMNTKTDEYTSAQYDSLNKLLKSLKSRYKIKYTLGHNQIAPGRKDDPWNFSWSSL